MKKGIAPKRFLARGRAPAGRPSEVFLESVPAVRLSPLTGFRFLRSAVPVTHCALPLYGACWFVCYLPTRRMSDRFSSQPGKVSRAGPDPVSRREEHRRRGALLKLSFAVLTSRSGNPLCSP